MLQKIKDFYKRSESIFLARLQVFVGFVIASVGVMDWSPLWSTVGTGTDFNWKQLGTIGAIVIANGVLFEYARRRNDPTLGK